MKDESQKPKHLNAPPAEKLNNPAPNPRDHRADEQSNPATHSPLANHEAPKEIQNAFEDPNYKKSRAKWIGNISRASKYAAIERYVGGMALGFFSLAFGAVVNGAAVLSLTVGGFIAVGVAASLVGAYAHYQNRKVSDPIALERGEQADIARSRMMGKSISIAMQKDTPKTEMPPTTLNTPQSTPQLHENQQFSHQTASLHATHMTRFTDGKHIETTADKPETTLDTPPAQPREWLKTLPKSDITAEPTR